METDNLFNDTKNRGADQPWESATIRDPQYFDFEPARLSAAHLGAGETSETNIKV